MTNAKLPISRRAMVKGGLAVGAAAGLPTRFAIAQAKALKVGLMLPYSGTYAKLGENIASAVELLVAEKGGKLGGRDIEFVRLDDESKPPNGPQNAERLVKRDGVDVLIGTVHSGVQMGIHKVVRELSTLTIIPNAGANAVTRELCAPNVFRTSFTNWQPAHGMGLNSASAGSRRPPGSRGTMARARNRRKVSRGGPEKSGARWSRC
ncbi:MAG: ABC transporter substrate-binding protein [Hyphomicrobiaceae bacterium]